MIILGLGSNVGDRLTVLRQAVSAISAIQGLRVSQLSPLYLSDALLPDNAPTDWDQPYINLALSCETTLSPLELLDELKTIEWSIGRKPEKRRWGPRILDIDILIFDNEIIQSDRLTIPHSSLLERPFALWPLCDLFPDWVYPLEGPMQGLRAAELVEKFGSRFTGLAPLHTWQLSQQIKGPKLVGILNVTPDSFSDGNSYSTTEKAIEQAMALVECGAEVLDIGAESTAPRATPIDHKTEWQRLEPILLGLKAMQGKFILPPTISVDTRHPETAKRALALGIDWLNDVSGFSNQAMRALAKESKVTCVMMHHVTIPASKMHILPRGEDPVQKVLAWGKAQCELLERDGIDQSKIIFDPGIGFGKSAEQSFALVKRAGELKALNLPILIGHSRKTFYSLFTAYPPAERDIETLVTSYALCDNKVDYLRVHNVEASARALKLYAALKE